MNYVLFIKCMIPQKYKTFKRLGVGKLSLNKEYFKLKWLAVEFQVLILTFEVLVPLAGCLTGCANLRLREIWRHTNERGLRVIIGHYFIMN